MNLSEETKQEALRRLRERDRRLAASIDKLTARGRPAVVLRNERNRVQAALARFRCDAS
jgi:hypothetical protein